MKVLEYVVLGDPRTKKNHQNIAGAGRRCPVCGKFEKQWVRQGKNYDAYAVSAKKQIFPLPRKPIDYPINIRYLFYMQTHRIVDELNLEGAMDDILIDAKVIADDNSRIVAGHDGTRVLYDKDNPRTEIYITRMPADRQMRLDD